MSQQDFDNEITALGDQAPPPHPHALIQGVAETEVEYLRGQLDLAQMVSERRKHQVDALEAELEALRSQKSGNPNSFRARSQLSDSQIVQKFDTLFEQLIPTWANTFDCDSRPCAPADTIDPSDLETYSQATIWAETIDSLETTVLGDQFRRHNFARGLLAYLLCSEIFPPNGKDVWLDEELGNSLGSIESHLLTASKSPIAALYWYTSSLTHIAVESERVTHREYNDWRAMTLSVLFKATSERSYGESQCFDLIKRKTQLLDRWELRSHARQQDTSSELLRVIVKEAVDLSQILRQQRPNWSVTLPRVILKFEDGETRAVAVDYDGNNMVDREKPSLKTNLSPEDWKVFKVDSFITPILSKRGNLGGDKFDVEDVVRKAEVLATHME